MAWKENKVVKKIIQEYPYLSHSDHNAKELLSSIEESSVLGCVSHLNELGTGQKLHDQTQGDNVGDTQLHEGSSVGGKDDMDPIELEFAEPLGVT
jgi:hypothetical protein